MSVIHEKNCKNLHPITDVSTGEIACGSCGSVILEKAVVTGSEQVGLSKEEYESVRDSYHEYKPWMLIACIAPIIIGISVPWVLYWIGRVIYYFYE